MTPRGIRYYVQRNLLPRPLSPGTGPIYTEEHLVRLRAIRALRAQGLPLDEIASRLRKASNDQLRALGEGPSGGSPEPAAPPDGSGPVGAPQPYRPQRWGRIELMPGLEIHVREDAGPVLTRLAAEIQARYSLQGG